MGRRLTKLDGDAAKKLQLEVIARAYVEGGCTYRGIQEALPDTAFQNMRARDVLRNGYFQAMVRQVLTSKFEQLELSPQRVLQETASIAFVKISDVFDEQGDLVEPYMLPAHVAAAIQSLEIEKKTEIRGKRSAKTEDDPDGAEGNDREEIVTKKYKFHDKNAALERLARHYKIVGGQDEGINALASALADRLKQARTRLPSAHAQPVEDANIIEAVHQPISTSGVQHEEPIW